MNDSDKEPEVHNTSSTDSLKDQRQIEDGVRDLPIRFSISYSQKKPRKSFKKDSFANEPNPLRKSQTVADQSTFNNKPTTKL